MKYNAARTHKLATLLSLQSGVCPDLPKVLVSGHACTRQGWTLIRCAQLPHSEASYITPSLNPIPKSQAQQQINASPVWFHPWCWMALLETYHNVPRFHWCWLYLKNYIWFIDCMHDQGALSLFHGNLNKTTKGIQALATRLLLTLQPASKSEFEAQLTVNMKRCTSIMHHMTLAVISYRAIAQNPRLIEA